MKWLRKAAENGYTDASAQLAMRMYGDEPYAREVGHVEEAVGSPPRLGSSWRVTTSPRMS